LDLHGTKYCSRVAALFSRAVLREFEELELYIARGDCLIA